MIIIEENITRYNYHFLFSAAEGERANKPIGERIVVPLQSHMNNMGVGEPIPDYNVRLNEIKTLIEIPENITFKTCVDINASNIKKLPKGMEVHGWLALNHLPEDFDWNFKDLVMKDRKDAGLIDQHPVILVDDHLKITLEDLTQIYQT